MVLLRQKLTPLPTYCIKSLCSGDMDPFNSLPIPTNPEVDYLLRYCRFFSRPLYSYIKKLRLKLEANKILVLDC